MRVRKARNPAGGLRALLAHVPSEAAMKHILIADHDPAMRLWISEALRAEKFDVCAVADGSSALKELRKAKFDLILLDDWTPHLNGQDVLAKLRKKKASTKVIVITSADTPEILLAAIREHAYQCIAKPFDRDRLIALVKESVQKKKPVPAIEVISARPEWVEVLVPCCLDAAERFEAFLCRLETGLAEDVRSSVSHAFHELLMNAIEWGGKLNPKRKVRISVLRTKRMLLCRIADPGPGFKFSDLDHAAISHGEEPIEHGYVREQKGLRPGGFGLLLVKAKVDELLYNEAQNEVMFVKYLDSRAAETALE
jgi:CheY-like chemotaxis protein/anti-sigma regulatory factor (Ser/Thr protein kinase)